MTVDSALRQGVALLEAAGIQPARLTAEVLLMHVLRRERAWLYAHDRDELAELEWVQFGRILHERLRGRHTQHLTGVQEFYGRDFQVSPAVLIPRPETEHVVERALPLARAGTVADIGCGSGAIGVTLALETGRPVVLTDLSAAALAVAAGNALRLGAPARLLQGDLVSMFASASLDVLVSNPPYVARDEQLAPEVRDHEPALALFGGVTGDEVYRRLFAEAARVVKPGGWIILELGWRSAAAVREMASGAWTDLEIRPDLAGRDRVFAARLR